MATENRDNFSAKTKKILAERVGFLCSCPNCRVPTIGTRATLSNANCICGSY